MEPQRTTGLTYDDWVRLYPGEHEGRMELIDGEIVVTASPLLRHQRAVFRIALALNAYAQQRGGETFGNPVDVFLSETNVLEPDVVYIRPEHIDPGEDRFLRTVDFVVEVSSPSTRARDLGRKRELYEAHGVPEYWFVDLDADRILVHVLEGGRYGPPATPGPGERLVSVTLPGLELDIAEALARP